MRVSNVEEIDLISSSSWEQTFRNPRSASSIGLHQLSGCEHVYYTHTHIGECSVDIIYVIGRGMIYGLPNGRMYRRKIVCNCSVWCRWKFVVGFRVKVKMCRSERKRWFVRVFYYGYICKVVEDLFDEVDYVYQCTRASYNSVVYNAILL